MCRLTIVKAFGGLLHRRRPVILLLSATSLPVSFKRGLAFLSVLLTVHGAGLQ